MAGLTQADLSSVLKGISGPSSGGGSSSSGSSSGAVTSADLQGVLSSINHPPSEPISQPQTQVPQSAPSFFSNPVAATASYLQNAVKPVESFISNITKGLDFTAVTPSQIPSVQANVPMPNVYKPQTAQGPVPQSGPPPLSMAQNNDASKIRDAALNGADAGMGGVQPYNFEPNLKKKLQQIQTFFDSQMPPQFGGTAHGGTHQLIGSQQPTIELAPDQKNTPATNQILTARHELMHQAQDIVLPGKAINSFASDFNKAAQQDPDQFSQLATWIQNYQKADPGYFKSNPNAVSQELFAQTGAELGPSVLKNPILSKYYQNVFLTDNQVKGQSQGFSQAPDPNSLQTKIGNILGSASDVVLKAVGNEATDFMNNARYMGQIDKLNGQLAQNSSQAEQDKVNQQIASIPRPQRVGTGLGELFGTSTDNPLASGEFLSAANGPKIVRDVAGFFGFEAVKSAVISAVTGGKGSQTSDLIPNASPQIKNIVDTADVVGALAIMHGLDTQGPKFFDAMTKEVIQPYDLPKTVEVSAKDLGIMGEDTRVFLKDQGLSDAQINVLRKQAGAGSAGKDIQIPIETAQLPKLVDKPYWAALKTVLHIPGTNETIGTAPEARVGETTATDQPKDIAGMLPSGEHAPQEVINAIFENKLQTTPEGQAALKASVDAQRNGQNIFISKAGETPTIKDLYAPGGTSEAINSSPSGINDLYAPTNDTSQIAPATTETQQPVVTSTPGGTTPTVTGENGATPSKVALSIQQKAIEDGLNERFGHLAGFDKSTNKEQAAMVAKIFEDPKNAEAIIRGEVPLDPKVLPSAMIVGMEEHILQQPDQSVRNELRYQLSNSPFMTTTSKSAQIMQYLNNREQDGLAASLQRAKQVLQTPKATRITREAKATLVEAATKTTLPKEDQSWDKFLEGIRC